MQPSDSMRSVAAQPAQGGELWREGAAPEDAQEAEELSAMTDTQLDAEMAEELGPVRRWMQDNAAAAEFANELYPDLLDIDDARHAVEDHQAQP